MTEETNTFEAQPVDEAVEKANTVLASFTKEDGTLVEMTVANSEARRVARRAVTFLKANDPDSYAKYKTLKFPQSTLERRVPATTESKQLAYEFALSRFAEIGAALIKAKAAALAEKIVADAATEAENVQKETAVALVNYDQSVHDAFAAAQPSYDNDGACDDGFDEDEDEDEDEECDCGSCGEE